LPVRRRLRPRQSACPAADSGVYSVLQLASVRRSRRPTSGPPSRASDHSTTPNRIRLSCRELRVSCCIPLHRKSASCFVRGACCSLSVCCPLVPVPAAISFPHPFPLPCPCCPIHVTSPLPLFCRSVETAREERHIETGGEDDPAGAQIWGRKAACCCCSTCRSRRLRIISSMASLRAWRGVRTKGGHRSVATSGTKGATVSDGKKGRRTSSSASGAAAAG